LQTIRCNTLHHTVTHCNKQQHSATNFNALQHTFAHCGYTQKLHAMVSITDFYEQIFEKTTNNIYLFVCVDGLYVGAGMG